MSHPLRPETNTFTLPIDPSSIQVFVGVCVCVGLELEFYNLPKKQTVIVEIIS